ncbi:MAG TPA: nucleotidyl transferase AbiEii/AbiGii toxin family protein [Mycobacteriales bacterium]|nr:nucleotidyl transferase AbiEii/AbiGii toxin family protein [Mycobacteriales bacterium]
MSVYDHVVAALNASGARYVVVGGIAVVLHGHARMTVDLDVVVDLAVEPAEAVISALADVGLRPRLPVEAMDFADPEVRGDWVDNRNLKVFSLYDPQDARREVDLFASYPMPFEELVAGSVEMPFGDSTVRVASITHLIALKRAAARPRDLEDIAALTALLERTPNAD